MLKLVITDSKQEQGIAHHFYVERDGQRVADLFVIPALTYWNDQLRNDIAASIRVLLLEVFSAEEIADLQEQAWIRMRELKWSGVTA